MVTNFLLGQLRITPEARSALGRLPYDLLCRHAIGEHGLITDEERQGNAIGLLTLGPIVSRYWLNPTDRSKGKVKVTTASTWHETRVTLDRG